MVYKHNVHRWTWFYKSMFMDKRFLWYCTIWLHRILVYDSMSTIGIWVLRASPLWREPPPKTLIPWYWSELGATCYAFVAWATSRIQNPNSIEAWELRARPLCESHLQNPYPRILALWGRIIVHLCLWGVSMVLMRWWPLGPATSMLNIWLFSLVIHG